MKNCCDKIFFLRHMKRNLWIAQNLIMMNFQLRVQMKDQLEVHLDFRSKIKIIQPDN